jgi:hypothetical protein
METVTTQRNGQIALEMSGLIQLVDGDMVGVESKTQNPRWDTDSWNGRKYERFLIDATAKGLPKVKEALNREDLDYTID